MRNYTAKDVDEYIVNMSPEAQPHLKELRKVIKAAVPKAEESIAWGVPFYKYNGLLGGFSAFTKHVSFGFAPVIEDKVRTKLEKAGYKTGSKTIQIQFDQKIPVAAITQIVKEQAKWNETNKK
jgi:uncharacterized protein YdhG (YjbR/CyaY superfamily)